MKTLKERFEEKYVVDNTTGCWMWTAYRRDALYGTICVDGDSKYAHRVSYELYKSAIPKDLCVLHRCDTPACVNPEHLFLGTAKDNTKDMCCKGRQAHLKGSKHGASKLKELQVRIINRLLAFDTLLQREIGCVFGVGREAISKIKNKRRWTHVKGDYYVEA